MAIYSGFTHWKWVFSIVMLVYQRVHLNLHIASRLFFFAGCWLTGSAYDVTPVFAVMKNTRPVPPWSPCPTKIHHVSLKHRDQLCSLKPVDWSGYGSIPINTILNGMNIHRSQLFWGSLGTRVLTHPHLIKHHFIRMAGLCSPLGPSVDHDFPY